MYCMKCGTPNSDDDFFCTSCGAELRPASIHSQDASTTQRDPRRDTARSTERFSLVDALHHTLKAAGISILKEPTRLLGFTADVVDTDAPDFRVFERNCDRDTLAPFVNVTSRSFDADRLDDAASRTYLLLCDRSIDAQAADAVAKSLRNAIARHASLPEVEIPPIVDNYSGGSFDGGSQGFASQQSTNRTWDASSQYQNESPRQRRPTAMPDNSNRFNDVDYVPQQSSTGPHAVPGSQGDMSQYAPSQPYVPQPPIVSPPKRSSVHPALVALLIVLILAVGVATYAVVNKTSQEGNVRTEQVTVAFSGGSYAKGKMSAIEVDKDDVLTLPDCDYTRKGYSFDYWRANGEDFSPGDKVTVSKDTTFTATWTADESESDNKEDSSANKDNSESSGSKNDDSASTKSESPVTTITTPTQQSQPETQPEVQKSPAESFPHKWQGTYTGTSSYVAGDGHITRAVAFNFSTVMESGYLEGICYVGTYDRGAGETYGTCYISGNVDWSTGAISLRGTGWIDHGGLGELREYSGSVNFSAQTMGGTAWDVGTGNYETPWNISAVSEIAIEQNGSMTRV